ncbi:MULTISPECIES: hypothetical protein [Salinimonas]|uniref:Uncharacterized protein n=2 Tax=Salinimonas TaxID=288793 RepID=A0A5B7YIU0_9ALTE|nr:MULTISPECIES: hypothetical protein [Salinimonas]MBD3587714.1 hypothetical protein [Salinimonas profundi]QCZ95415.1 hypothetical protein FBQ74_17925 [Salinimonas iocasae]
MDRLKRDSLPLEDVKARLHGVVSNEYVWPEEPAGWWLEFIAYPDGGVIMDLLHPVSANWWSDDNDFLPQPFCTDGREINASILAKAVVPFMGTFGVAEVGQKQSEHHLSVVAKS